MEAGAGGLIRDVSSNYDDGASLVDFEPSKPVLY